MSWIGALNCGNELWLKWYFLLPQEEEESDIMSLKPVSCEYELVN